MDFLLDLPSEDMGMDQQASSSMMCEESNFSLQLSDLQDMHVNATNSSRKIPGGQEFREMVVNPGGMWTAHNKRSSAADQGSSAMIATGVNVSQDQQMSVDLSNSSVGGVQNSGSGVHQCQQYPFSKAARTPQTGDRPIKKQRVTSSR